LKIKSRIIEVEDSYADGFKDTIFIKELGIGKNSVHKRTLIITTDEHSEPHTLSIPNWNKLNNTIKWEYVPIDLADFFDGKGWHTPISLTFIEMSSDFSQDDKILIEKKANDIANDLLKNKLKNKKDIKAIENKKDLINLLEENSDIVPSTLLEKYLSIVL